MIETDLVLRFHFCFGLLWRLLSSSPEEKMLSFSLTRTGMIRNEDIGATQCWIVLGDKARPRRWMYIFTITPSVCVHPSTSTSIPENHWGTSGAPKMFLCVCRRMTDAQVLRWQAAGRAKRRLMAVVKRRRVKKMLWTEADDRLLKGAAGGSLSDVPGYHLVNNFYHLCALHYK